MVTTHNAAYTIEGHYTAITPQRLTAKEEHKRGHRDDVIATYKLTATCRAYVDTQYRHTIAKGECYTVERRVHSLARPTPRGIKIDEHQSLRANNPIKI